jgi:hypothetical protein
VRMPPSNTVHVVRPGERMSPGHGTSIIILNGSNLKRQQYLVGGQKHQQAPLSP